MTEYRIVRIYDPSKDDYFWWEIQEKKRGWFTSHWERVADMLYNSEPRAIQALKVLKGES